MKEEMARKCLKDFVDRSLIFLLLFEFRKIEIYRIHGMTNELCSTEAQNMHFVNITNGKNEQYLCAHLCFFSSQARYRINIRYLAMSVSGKVDTKF